MSWRGDKSSSDEEAGRRCVLADLGAYQGLDTLAGTGDLESHWSASLRNGRGCG